MERIIEGLIIYTPMYVAFFWAIVLLSSFSQNNKAKFFLGVNMFVAVILYACHALFFHKAYQSYLIFGPIYTFASLSIFPLYYWYIKLLTIESGYKLHNLRLLLPAFLFALSEVVIYQIMSPTEQVNYIQGFILFSASFFSLYESKISFTRNPIIPTKRIIREYFIKDII